MSSTQMLCGDMLSSGDQILPGQHVIDFDAFLSAFYWLGNLSALSAIMVININVLSALSALSSEILG